MRALREGGDAPPPIHVGKGPGTHVNTTNDLTSSSGNNGPATDTLVVSATLLDIPTLGVWGLMLLAGLLALVALWQLNLR